MNKILFSPSEADATGQLDSGKPVLSTASHIIIITSLNPVKIPWFFTRIILRLYY